MVQQTVQKHYVSSILYVTCNFMMSEDASYRISRIIACRTWWIWSCFLTVKCDVRMLHEIEIIDFIIQTLAVTRYVLVNQA